MRTRQCKIEIINVQENNERVVTETQPTQYWNQSINDEKFSLNQYHEREESSSNSRKQSKMIEQKRENNLGGNTSFLREQELGFCGERENCNNNLGGSTGFSREQELGFCGGRDSENCNNNLGGNTNFPRESERGFCGGRDSENWYNNNNNQTICFDPDGFGQHVEERDESEVDVVSKYFTWNIEGSGIRKRRKSTKNNFKIIVAKELMRRYLNYNDWRSYNDLRALCITMTREERFSLFNIVQLLKEQNEMVSSRKNKLILIIFDFDKLPNNSNDKEDVNVT